MLILVTYYIFDIAYKMYNQNEDFEQCICPVKALLPTLNMVYNSMQGYGFPIGRSLAVSATGN